MTERGNGHAQDDFIGAGFHQLDDELIHAAAPKIAWGRIYREKWDDEHKIEYLEKLAATMNHAAYLIQKERNKLNELMAQKEAALTTSELTVQQTQAMLTTEITKMNAERQNYNAAIAARNRTIESLEREVARLKDGNHG